MDLIYKALLDAFRDRAAEITPCTLAHDDRERISFTVPLQPNHKWRREIILLQFNADRVWVHPAAEYGVPDGRCFYYCGREFPADVIEYCIELARLRHAEGL